jgi:hypothetical protein
MESLVTLLTALCAVLGWAAVRYRRALKAHEAAKASMGPLIARQQNPEVLSALSGGGDWWPVLSSGDNLPGIHLNEGQCPGQMFYTVSTRQTIISRPPLTRWLRLGRWSPAEFGFPPPAPAEGCPEDCAPLFTHQWHGWTVAVNLRTGQYVVNANTYAQYRCVMRGSPELGKPPRAFPPEQLDRSSLL